MIDANTRIAIAGTGAIGCYVGGCLALAGRNVCFLARPGMAAGLKSHGLRVTDLDGADRLLEPGEVAAAADPAAALADADVVLVSVKSGASEEMAALVAAHAPKGAKIVSLQNGVDNAGRIEAVAGRPVLAGMVPFNVVLSRDEDGPVRVHRASEGKVLVEDGLPGLAGLLSVEGCRAEARAGMEAVLWGKLLFNLNNALVALSGLPLAQELGDRRWRLIFAEQIVEALAAMQGVGIEPAAAAGSLKPAWLPFALRLPDWPFRVLARRMLAIDRNARSSMWDDLERRKPTEIDEFQGAILRLARQAGTAAPMTARVRDLLGAAERAGNGSPRLTPDAFR